MHSYPVLIFLALLCTGSVSAASQPNAPVRRVDLAVKTDLGLHRFHVEVAATPQTRERGLMGRTKLAVDGGMLFIFDEQADHTFWMKGTPLALDMLFVGEAGQVLGVISRAAPFTLTGRHIGLPSKMVLELLGGTAEHLHIRPGTQIQFVGGVPST